MQHYFLTLLKIFFCVHAFSFITKHFLIFILFSYFIPIKIVSVNFSLFVIPLCLFFLFPWFLTLWQFVWRIILCMIKILLNWLKLISPWHMVPLDSVFVFIMDRMCALLFLGRALRICLLCVIGVLCCWSTLFPC